MSRKLSVQFERLLSFFRKSSSAFALEPTYDAKAKIIRGPKVTFDLPDESLGHEIIKNLIQNPDVVTQISTDNHENMMTNFEIYKRAMKIATYLSNMNVNPGDVIGFVTENSPNLASIVVACFALGCTINPLATSQHESDLIYMFGKTKPKVIFCDEKNVKTVQYSLYPLKNDAKIIVVGGESVRGYEDVDSILLEIDDLADDIFE
jgi:long-subunit acyl-CoA synthetase (AMP-forming)